MNRALKIVIISLLGVLVTASLLVFFLAKKSNIADVATEKRDKEWESLKTGDFNNFLSNNFVSELAQKIDADSFVIFGVLNKQYLNENSRIIYVKDKNSVYVRSFCNELDFFVKIDQSDVDSFEILGNCYSRDKNNVYFADDIISGADPLTFEVIEENYAKDKENIYFRQLVIIGADINTFKVTSNNRARGYYSKDKRYIYKEEIMVSDLKAKDPDKDKEKEEFVDCLNEELDKYSLEIINENFIKDKYYVYFIVKKGDSSYCDRIEGADPNTFEVISGFWGKDANNIFYNAQKVEEGQVDFGTFEIIDDNFAKDSDNVYYQEIIIPEADPGTFIPISDNYSEDDDNVFLNEDVIFGADPDTFEVIVDDGDEQYGVDEDNVYEGTEIVEDADPEDFDVEEFSEKELAIACLPDDIKDSINVASFTQIGSCHAKDNNYVFFKPNCGQDCSYQVMQADPNSFAEIRFNHSKDANNIYYLDSKINGVDSGTFEVFFGSTSYAKDSQNVYFREKIITGADVITFEVISDSWVDGFFGKDKDYMYEGINRLENDVEIFVDPPVSSDGENCYYKKGVDVYVEKFCK